MCGLMNVQVELWPVAADDAGVWLLSGKAPLLSAPIPQDSDPHYEVEWLLGRLWPLSGGVSLVHSTSWRPDGPHVVLTYVAVIDTPAPVLSDWSGAAPISALLLESVGPMPTNAAHDAPRPRHIDVLVHAVRHLRFLQEFDATAADALPPAWDAHLAKLRPSLAGLYSIPHAS